ncbi:MAG: substrate-binding domain-containing protein [Steroidobacteraceae bacterium]
MTSSSRLMALGAALALAVAGATSAASASAGTVEIFAAGSLRGVVSDLAKAAGAAYHIEVQASFGGSGSLRERIEHGANADLLMSADLGSPRKLEAEGRTAVPVAAFARNRMCIVSRRSAGVTPANLVDRMLAKGMRIRTSTPIVDPSGDYAWAIFERINRMRPGTGAILERRARALMGLTAKPAPGQSKTAALFAARRIDMTITYCSGATKLVHEVPGLTSFAVPARLDPHPTDGLAVLSARPDVMRLALLLLSEKGQAIVAKNGLVPVTALSR